MSSFSICKVYSGSDLVAGLPNQVLGKVAAFIMSPAWLVTSFMLHVCLCAQRGSTHGKQKEHQTYSHGNPPGEIKTFLSVTLPSVFLPRWSNPLTMHYHLGICIQKIHPVWKKICIAHEGSQGNTVQTWKSLPYHLGHLPRQPYLKKQNSKTLLGEILPCHVP